MILIIGDKLRVGTELERLLQSQGLETVSFADGWEALKSVPPTSLQLIILYLDMVLLRQIRQDPAFKRIPVLTYSSGVSFEEEAAAIDAGAQGVIEKGEWERLEIRVRELLGMPGEGSGDTPGFSQSTLADEA